MREWPVTPSPGEVFNIRQEEEFSVCLDSRLPEEHTQAAGIEWLDLLAVLTSFVVLNNKIRTRTTIQRHVLTARSVNLEEQLN